MNAALPLVPLRAFAERTALYGFTFKCQQLHDGTCELLKFILPDNICGGYISGDKIVAYWR